MKYILVLALFVLGSQAVPLKDNAKEVKKLEDEAKVIVGDATQVKAFQDAVTNNDIPKVKELLETMVGAQRRAHDNLVKAFPKIEHVTSAFNKLSSGKDLNGVIDHLKNLPAIVKDGALHFLAAFLDGNRDNVSWYMYDAAQRWIEARVGGLPDSSGLKGKLTDAKNLIEETKNSLQDTADVFVATIKEIRTAGDNKKIREQVDKLVKAVKDSDLINKSTKAMNKVDEVAKDPQ